MSIYYIVDLNSQEIYDLFFDSEVMFVIRQVHGPINDVKTINYLHASNDNIKHYFHTFITTLNKYLQDFLTNEIYFFDIYYYKEIIAHNLLFVKIFLSFLKQSIIWIRDENNNFINN